LAAAVGCALAGSAQAAYITPDGLTNGVHNGTFTTLQVSQTDPTAVAFASGSAGYFKAAVTSLVNLHNNTGVSIGYVPGWLQVGGTTTGNTNNTRVGYTSTLTTDYTADPDGNERVGYMLKSEGAVVPTYYMVQQLGTGDPLLGSSEAYELQPLVSYNLSIDVGNRFATAFDAGSTPVIELYAGATLLGTATGTKPAANSWQTWTLNYVAPASPPTGQLEIRLSYNALSTSTTNQVQFDNVSLTAVPEPTSIASLGILGLGGLLLRRRRHA
jgi:hypothetical protein